jgi:hypothetical protein
MSSAAGERLDLGEELLNASTDFVHGQMADLLPYRDRLDD